MQQIIQLKPEDDIAAIRARIELAELAFLVLMVPRDCALLQTSAGMQLLRRAADDLGVQIALVVHDEQIREHAEEYGIPVFHSLASAQRTHWRMSPPMRPTEKHSAPTLADMPERTSFTLSPKSMKEYRAAILLAVMVLLLLCVAAFLFAPTAQVRLAPASVAFTTNTDILVDSSMPQIDASTRSIPARRLLHEISGTLQLKTTTTKNMPDARATGTVVFTNQRTEETTIPPGTIVRTSGGVPIRFTTTTTTTIPAGVGNRAEAPIQAVDPGPGGNVQEVTINTIEGSLALAVRVINTKPTVSGNVRPVKVATADDKKKLEDQLLKQLLQQAPALLNTNLKPNEIIPPDSVLVDASDKLFDHAVDEPADVLTLKMTADAFGLAVDQDDLNSLVELTLSKQLQEGYQFLPQGIQVDFASGGKYQGIQLRQPIRAVGYAAPQLDPAKVARALQGKSIDEAKTFLSNSVSLARPPEINVSPMGWFRMPWFAFRIAVFVETPAVGK